MPGSVATYNPEKCQIVLGAAPVTGFADGSFVTVEQDEDSWSLKAGADGEVARSKRVARTGTMTLTLLATSISNAILTALHEATDPFPVLIKEGGTVIFAADGWVQKPAAFERGTDVSDTEWTIRLAHVDLSHAGNP